MPSRPSTREGTSTRRSDRPKVADYGGQHAGRRSCRRCRAAPAGRGRRRAGSVHVRGVTSWRERSVIMGVGRGSQRGSQAAAPTCRGGCAQRQVDPLGQSAVLRTVACESGWQQPIPSRGAQHEWQLQIPDSASSCAGLTSTRGLGITSIPACGNARAAGRLGSGVGLHRIARRVSSGGSRDLGLEWRSAQGRRWSGPSQVDLSPASACRTTRSMAPPLRPRRPRVSMSSWWPRVGGRVAG